MKNSILFLLLIASSLFAENTDFSVIVKKPFDAALFDITQNYDRTISAVGFSKEFKQNANNSAISYDNAFDYLASVSSKYGSQMHLIQIDDNAKIVLSKHASLSRFNEAIAVVKTPTNGYFVGGYTLDGSLLILKLDANANIELFKTFGTKNYDKMSNLVLMSDGGVLAIGSSVTSRATTDRMFETGLGNNDIYITRFSKDGTLLWSKKYGTEYDDAGVDAVEAIDGSILVIGTTSYNKNRDVSFMRLTENGDRVWLKHYKDETNSDNLIIPRKIIRLKDNNFVIALSQYNDMQKEHIRLVKIDLYQNILADKEVFTTYPSAINDIKEFSDGSFIAVGYVKDTQNTDGLAMILDSNLEMLIQEHYGDENYDVFNAVTILHNSQAAVAGVHTDNNSQESNMWVLKLNKDASKVQITTSKTELKKELNKVFKDEINSKSIAIQDDLTLLLDNSAIYFDVSKYELNEKQKAYLDEFSKKLIPFLEKNKSLIQTLEVNGHTSSEWGNDKFTESYLKNEKLSLNRSYSVLSHIFKSQSLETQQWLYEILKGSGLSFSKNVIKNDIEDKNESRRVSFKLILK